MESTIANVTEYRNLPLAALTESTTNPRRIFEDDDMKELLHVDADEWRAELPSIIEFFAEFEDRLPPAVADQLEGLKRRLA